MTEIRPEPGAGPGSAQPLDPSQLGTYFVLLEAVSLLQYELEQQLRAEGGITFVQFQLLARLGDARGPLTMTQLADGLVYSRSGLTSMTIAHLAQPEQHQKLEWLDGGIFSVLLDKVATDGKLTVGRFDVAKGEAPPFHAHTLEDEVFLLLKGTALV
jgi:hypothetical protein